MSGACEDAQLRADLGERGDGLFGIAQGPAHANIALVAVPARIALAVAANVKRIIKPPGFFRTGQLHMTVGWQEGAHGMVISNPRISSVPSLM